MSTSIFFEFKRHCNSCVFTFIKNPKKGVEAGLVKAGLPGSAPTMTLKTVGKVNTEFKLHIPIYPIKTSQVSLLTATAAIAVTWFLPTAHLLRPPTAYLHRTKSDIPILRLSESGWRMRISWLKRKRKITSTQGRARALLLPLQTLTLLPLSH